MFAAGTHTLLGSTDASTGFWMLEIDPATGDPQRSRLFENREPLRAHGVLRTADGGLLAVGRGIVAGEWRTVLIRLDPAGDVLWARSYPFTTDIGFGSAWEQPDGTLRMSGWDGSVDAVWVVALEADGSYDGSCLTSDAFAVTVTDAVPAWFGGSTPPFLGADAYPGAITGAASTPAVADWDDCACAVPPTDEVRLLKATRSGGDALLRWAADPAATGYNVWTVTAKRDIELARLATAPPAVGVAGCSSPSPAPSNACTDIGAVARGTRLYYQCGPPAGRRSRGRSPRESGSPPPGRERLTPARRERHGSVAFWSHSGPQLEARSSFFDVL